MTTMWLFGQCKDQKPESHNSNLSLQLEKDGCKHVENRLSAVNLRTLYNEAGWVQVD
jgi:hypothetical protein